MADPSHVPFAHHGVQGNRERARPIPMEVLSSTPEGIEVQTQGQFSSNIIFEPPCRLEYTLDFGNGRKVGLVTYCVPTSPGRSRIVAQFPRNFATRIHHFTPRWAPVYTQVQETATCLAMVWISVGNGGPV